MEHLGIHNFKDCGWYARRLPRETAGGVAWQISYDTMTEEFVGGSDLIYLPSSAGTDIEACTQVALNNESQLYVMAENQGRIVQFNDLGSEDVTYKYWDLEEQNNGHAMPQRIMMDWAQRGWNS